MAIDSTLYAADIPAGTYAVGDVVQLVNIEGPANVRSGRGAAKLKRILAAQLAAQTPYWRIHVKNSDWIDDVASFTGPLAGQLGLTVLDDEAGTVQKGHDCNLTPNSGWQVYAECVLPGTSTTGNSIFALIDVDYPEAGGVTEPSKAVGLPTSIDFDLSTTSIAFGALVGSGWVSQNVDYFKAGYKYVLDAVEVVTTGTSVGFVAFSNAAGMSGLTRIIPVTSSSAAIRSSVRYSSVLFKGPMDVKVKMLQATAASVDIYMAHDYVKQKA